MTIHELIKELQAAAKQYGGDIDCVISTRKPDELAQSHHDLPEISYVVDKSVGDYIRIHCGH